MKERPILFSAPMVRAILDGRKTQTRRVVKFSRPFEEHRHWGAVYDAPSGGYIFVDRPLQGGADEIERLVRRLDGGKGGMLCPYGQPGDRLWVKESLQRKKTYFSGPTPWSFVSYDASGEFALDRMSGSSFHQPARRVWLWKRTYLPARFMPRWASRLTLEVASIRVERLRDISEADARAEGVDWAAPDYLGPEDYDDREDPRQVGYPSAGASFARDNFGRLWDSLNAKRGHSWESNPWVWVVEFRRVS